MAYSELLIARESAPCTVLDRLKGRQEAEKAVQRRKGKASDVPSLADCWPGEAGDGVIRSTASWWLVWPALVGPELEVGTKGREVEQLSPSHGHSGPVAYRGYGLALNSWLGCCRGNRSEFCCYEIVDCPKSFTVWPWSIYLSHYAHFSLVDFFLFLLGCSNTDFWVYSFMNFNSYNHYLS